MELIRDRRNRHIYMRIYYHAHLAWAQRHYQAPFGPQASSHSPRHDYRLSKFVFYPDHACTISQKDLLTHAQWYERR